MIYSVFMTAEFCIRVDAENEKEATNFAHRQFGYASDDYEMDISRVKVDSVCEE